MGRFGIKGKVGLSGIFPAAATSTSIFAPIANAGGHFAHRTLLNSYDVTKPDDKTSCNLLATKLGFMF
jgi:hypothetical protein